MTLYRAGPANGTGKGRLASDWVRITDLTSDDIYATITAVTYDNNPTNSGVSSKFIVTVSFSATPADHSLAHHQAYNATAIPASGIAGVSSVDILDNVGSLLIYGVETYDHTPAVGNQLRLTSGANERGFSDSGNSSSTQLMAFATSSENSASPPMANSLWAFTQNLPKGIPQYNISGGCIYSTSTGGTADSDWIRRMDFFSYNDYPTPGASGGAQYSGTVDPPVSVGAGFGKRSDFTFFAGVHEGWLYCSLMPFQTENTGLSLYKTADGINWIKITDDGFGDNWSMARSFVSLGGRFYMGSCRPAIGSFISSSGTISSSVSATTTRFYEISGAYPIPSLHFPATGTLVLERSTVNNSPPESSIFVEKVNYTDNKISTVNTLQAGLPANHGTLAKHLWALDTQIFANGLNTSDSSRPDYLPPGPGFSIAGAILIEGEVIQYNSISGSTINIATRGTFGSPLTTVYQRGTYGPGDHGSANHAKGTPIFRTTGYNLNDYYIVLSGITNIATSGALRHIILDNEKITYATVGAGTSGSMTTAYRLSTPLRAIEATIPSSHSVGTTVYKGGWTGLTRGVYGTTSTIWYGGEIVNPVSFGSAELWVTD